MIMSRGSTGLMVAFSLALALDVPRAAAQTSAPIVAPVEVRSEVDRARALFRSGVRLSDELRWAEAAAAFAESYRLIPRAGTLQNLAMAHRALGRYRESIEELERFLALADAPDELRARIDEIVTEMRTHLSTIRIGVTATGSRAPGASLRVTLDARVVQPDSTTVVDPGSHVIIASAPGFARVVRTLDMPPASSETVALRLERLPSGVPWWVWPVAGVVVVGAAVVIGVAASGENPPDCSMERVCITAR